MKILPKSSLKVVSLQIILLFVIMLSIQVVVSKSSPNSVPIKTNTISATKKIAFTQNNGYFSPSSQYSQLASYFTSQGFTVDELTSDPNATYLATVDILFINSYQVSGFSPAARLAIYDFLFAGGGAIMALVNGALDSSIGLTMNTTLPIIGSHSLDIFPHPVTVGVTGPSILAGSVLGNITFTANNTRAVVSTTSGSTNPNHTIVAATYYGEGKIMACAVTTMWENSYLNNGDNKLIIENYLKWFTHEGVKNMVFSRHNNYFSPTNGFSKLADYFASRGYIIDDLGNYSSAIDPDASILATTDLLFVNSYQVGTFPTDAKDAIEDYVATGGGIIIVGSGGGLNLGSQSTTTANPLVGSHNLEYFLHPVLWGVTNISIDISSGLGTILPGDTAQVIVRTDNDSTNQEKPILVVDHYGEGKVMSSSITSLWDNPRLNDGDNVQILTNYLNWLTGNTTLQLPVVSDQTDLTFYENETGIELSWNTNGYFPYRFTLYQNSSEIASGSWSTAVPIIINIDGLIPGTYNFTIVIIDEYDRTASDTAMVTVQEVLTSIPTTDTSTSTTGPVTTPLSIIGVFTALLMGSLFILRRRRSK